MLCGNELDKLAKPHSADNAPLSEGAIRRGMKSLNDMAAKRQGKTVVSTDDGVGCGGESVAEGTIPKGTEFLRKALALRGDHPVVYGRDCSGRLTFASTPHGKPPTSSSEKP